MRRRPLFSRKTFPEMTDIIQITPGFAVAGQLSPDDFAHAAELGFRTIINNRPDGEERNQLSAAEGHAAAASNGLGYAYIPTTKHDIFTDAVVGELADLLAASDGPILAHCKSGQRSAILWAAAVARTQPVADVLATLRAAGLDLGFLRDELDRQADHARWSTKATDVGERARTPDRARGAAPAAA